MPESLLLQAFKGTNTTVPVWFMRQAGRYLPEYRALKAKYSLEQMFGTPELAAQITCLPTDILGVDAAILFADILTLPSAMGAKITFTNDNGPQIKSSKNLSELHDFDDLSSIVKTIKLVNKQLPGHIPLIGFTGGPFTVLTYLIEGGGALNFTKTFKFAYSEPQRFHQLLDLLTNNTIAYLKLQKDAGIKVFQIFDTWAGILTPKDYQEWVLPYLQRIFKKIDLPSIYFLRNSAHLISLTSQCGSDFLSVDHTIPIGDVLLIQKTKQGIQGNLFNGLLYSEDVVLKQEVSNLLKAAQTHQRFIFNLNHGVFPDVSVEKLKLIVKTVHQFQWKNQKI